MKTVFPASALAALAILLSTSTTFAEDPYSGRPGAPDLHFGEWGLGVATLQGKNRNLATDLGIDTLNRIVVAGTLCDVPGAAGCRPVLMRFDAAGHPDSTGGWSDEGLLPLSGSTVSEAAVAVAPASASGWWAAWRDRASSTMHLLRVTGDGDFASGFGPGEHIETLPRGTHTTLRLHSAAQALTEILWFDATADAPPLLMIRRRSAESGQLVSGFGEGGSVSMLLDEGTEVAGSSVFPDGRIAVLLMNWRDYQMHVLMFAEDGDSDAVFGESGVVDISDLLQGEFQDRGIPTQSFFAGGMGITPDDRLLVALTVFNDAAFTDHAAVAAIDASGQLTGTYADGGLLVFPLDPDRFGSLFPIGFGVDPLTGHAVFDVWNFTDTGLDTMLYITPDGQPDARYGDGTGTFADVVLPGSVPRSSMRMAFDEAGGVIALEAFANGFEAVLGLNGFGVTRFLAPGETRAYDSEPDQINDISWPAVQPGEIMQFNWDFRGRDTAIRVSITNGRVGLNGDGREYVFLPQVATIPLGVVTKLLHKSAATSGTYSESLVKAGTEPMMFSISSGTGEDHTPDAISFPVLRDAAQDLFVTSPPAAITGIDVPIDIRVENGCYFIFTSAAEIPDVLEENDCLTADGTAHDGQVIVVGHRSASEPSIETLSTLHYGSYSASFYSETAAALPPADREPDDFDIPGVVDAEPGAVIVIGPLALTGFDAAFQIGDTMNPSTARIKVSTDGETWAPVVDIEPGDFLWIRLKSAPSPATTLTGELYVTSPDNRKTFTITTKAASEPEQPEEPDEPAEPKDPTDPDEEPNAPESGGGALGAALLALAASMRARRRQSRS